MLLSHNLQPRIRTFIKRQYEKLTTKILFKSFFLLDFSQNKFNEIEDREHVKVIEIKEANKVTNPRARECSNCVPSLKLKEKASLTRTPLVELPS